MKILLYIYIFIFTVSMLIGAGYLLLAAMTIFTQGISAATPSFWTGIGILVAGYVTTVFVLFLFTKQWNWVLFSKKPSSVSKTTKK